MEIEGSSSRIANAQNAASRAEKDAAERISRAHKRVQEAEVEANRILEQQKDVYEKQTVSEAAKSAERIENLRGKSYERIRDLQQDYDQLAQKSVREGERDLNKVVHQSKIQLSDAQRKAEKEYKEAQQKNFAALEFERKTNDDKIAQLKNNYQNNIALMVDDRDRTFEQMNKSSQDKKKEFELKTKDAIALADEHYRDNFEKTIKHQQDSLARMNQKAVKEIEDTRLSTSHRLDSYSSRQGDPFYKLVNINARLSESNDQFVLTATVPQHEQDKISVTIQGNNLVVGGKRQNRESVEIEPGHKHTTASYQSFTETIPLNWPVNPKNMMREFDGDTLIVRIPKKLTYEPPHKKRTPDSQMDNIKPQFPKNLPNEEKLTQILEERAVRENTQGNTTIASGSSTRKPIVI